MPHLGLILTHAPDLVWLTQHLRAADATTLKVVTGWGVDGGWTPERIGVATRLAPTLIVRTVAGDPSAPGAPILTPDRVVAEITPWYAARNTERPFFIELGNEPLLTDSPDEIVAWEYAYWLKETVRACRAFFPAARLIAPAHILNHPIELGIEAWGQRRFMELCAEAVALCDAVALHCYTPDQVERGFAWCKELHPGKPIWVTEAGINAPLADGARGQALAAMWCNAPVAGVCFYHLVHSPGSDPLHFNPHYTLTLHTLEALGAAWRSAPTPAPMTSETIRLGGADDPPIWDLDLSDELDALTRPLRKPGALTPALRSGPDEGVVVHYGGKTQTKPRTRAQELALLRAYARHHATRSWSDDPKRPVYGDNIMYGWSVLSDGAIVRLRRDRRGLWHSGNATVNDTYEAVVLPLGEHQPLTDAQSASLTRLLDRLRGDRLSRDRVVGHCECPRRTGTPKPLPTYTIQPGQSECPGIVIHAWLATYRADVWARWGTAFPLPFEQRGWGIPQAWKSQAGALGEARSREVYSGDQSRSVQFFQGGVVIYDVRSRKTHVHLLPRVP